MAAGLISRRPAAETWAAERALVGGVVVVVVHGQVHVAAGDAGLVREDGQRGLVLAVGTPERGVRLKFTILDD